MQASGFSLLCAMPNCTYDDSPASQPISDYVRRTADYQFPDTGLRAASAQEWMISQEFHHHDNADRQALGCLGLVRRHVSPYFLQSRSRQGRPNNL